MLNKKFCIVIDDNDPTGTMNLVARRLMRDESIALSYEWLNIKSPEFWKDEVFLKDALITALNTAKFLKRSVDVILCDYALSPSFDGIDVVNILRKEFKSKKKIYLHSGGLEDAIDKILNTEERTNIKATTINKLVKLNIEFIQKEDYAQELINFIKGEPKFDFERELEEYFLRMPDFTLNFTTSHFMKQKLSNIAGRITNEMDTEAILFKKEFVEMAFSIMLDLNNPK